MMPADPAIAEAADPIEPAHIRLLDRNDVERFRALRFVMMRDTPSAFGASPEDEAALTPQAWAARIGPDHNTALFGAFIGDRMVGSTGLLRQRPAKMRHKGLIWCVFVDPAARGQRLAHRMMVAVIAHARAWPDMRQVTLSVTADNLRARAIYDNLGFVQYGHEPNALNVDGEWFDEQQMVLQFPQATA